MFAQLPMYQRKGPKALNHKLDNIQKFAALLKNPEEKFKSIHVAGTNGKGSSCHMLASILQEAGYRVGLYTSPHLKDFRERIKINGKPLSKRFVVDFIDTHRPFLEENGLSFFEMTVGMAFLYFAQEEVDMAVIEVGLGGRLDSTNIISPEVCLITNIGFDHMAILGDTLEKIAYEKAGIIKKKVPVVIGEKQPEIAAVFKQIATEKQSELVFASGPINYETDLLGDYQQKNILGVLATLNELRNFKIQETHIKKGLLRVVQNTGLLGRWQVLDKMPTIVTDTAHNEAGIMAVLDQIQGKKHSGLHFVLGFVDDKDLGRLLPLFPKDAKYYFVCPKVQRGLEAESLKKKASGVGLKGEAYDSVKSGLKAARLKAKEDDFIYVGGSTFVVAEIV